MDWEPVVAFSMSITRLTVLGAMVRVRVAVRVAEEVTLKYMARAGSEAPSATVVVESASEAKQSCRAVAQGLADELQVHVRGRSPRSPEPSPVASSVRRKSLT